MKEMSENEAITWAAGLYEGEGCFTLSIRNKGKYLYPRLQIKMGTIQVLQKFQSIFNVGSIEGPRKTKRSDHTPMWVYQVGKRKEVELIINQLYPFLSDDRQDQIDEILEKCAENPYKYIYNKGDK